MEQRRLFLPSVADELVGTSTLQSLKPLGEIVGIKKSLEVLSQLRMGLIEVSVHRLFFEGAVHPLNLPVRPRLVWLGQPMINVVRGA